MCYKFFFVLCIDNDRGVEFLPSTKQKKKKAVQRGGRKDWTDMKTIFSSLILEFCRRKKREAEENKLKSFHCKLKSVMFGQYRSADAVLKCELSDELRGWMGAGGGWRLSQNID